MDTSGDNHLENDTEQQAQKPEKESFFKPLLSFLIAPIFLRNLGAILLFILLSFFLFRGCMNLYTHHGESLEVHDYRGMTFKEAKQKARKRSFSVVVLDSIYIVGRAPNIVLEQNPAPFSQVKKNRNIYLTITSGQAPEVPLPSLVGNDDFQTYQRKLERLDLKLVVRERKFDRQLEENTILALFYNGNRYTSEDVKRGVKIPKGSTVEAVVTIRNTGTVQIPQLVCKRFSEASFLITGAKLKIGEVDGPASGRDNYYVWKQEPAYEEGKMIATGESVKLFLTGKKPDDCQ